MNLIPKVSAGGIQKTILSEEVMAVGAAILFGSVAASHLTNFISNLPFARDHVTFALIGLSVFILIFAVKMKTGTLKAIVIGLAGGTFFIGILQVDFVANALRTIQLRK